MVCDILVLFGVGKWNMWWDNKYVELEFLIYINVHSIIYYGHKCEFY